MQQQKGFTLIELLVIIAVTTLLATILFPVLSQARETTQKTSCLHNVKQIALASLMYQSDWDGAVAFNRECGNSLIAGNPPCVPGRALRGWIDLVYPYVKNYEIFKCPADPLQPVPLPADTSNQSGAPAAVGHVWGTGGELGGDYRCSYARNNNLANNGTNTAQDAQVQHPSTTLLIYEFAANSGGGANPNERGPATSYTIVRREATQADPSACIPYDAANSTQNNRSNFLPVLTGYPRIYAQERLLPSSERHQGGGNYAFFDGHAKYFRPASIKGQCSWSFASVPGTGTEYGNDGSAPDFRL